MGDGKASKTGTSQKTCHTSSIILSFREEKRRIIKNDSKLNLLAVKNIDEILMLILTIFL